MKKFLFLVITLLLLDNFSLFAGQQQDKALLFHMNYDNFEAAANYSKGHSKPLNFKGNLMLRMHPGPGHKGNALCYNNGENLHFEEVIA